MKSCEASPPMCRATAESPGYPNCKHESTPPKIESKPSAPNFNRSNPKPSIPPMSVDCLPDLKNCGKRSSPVNKSASHHCSLTESSLMASQGTSASPSTKPDCKASPSTKPRCPHD